jgi:hypothetical protein
MRTFRKVNARPAIALIGGGTGVLLLPLVFGKEFLQYSTSLFIGSGAWVIVELSLVSDIGGAVAAAMFGVALLLLDRFGVIEVVGDGKNTIRPHPVHGLSIGRKGQISACVYMNASLNADHSVPANTTPI